MQTLQIGDDWHTERVGGLNFYYYELLRHLGATGTLVHGLVVGSDSIRTSTQGQVVAFAKQDDNLARRMFSVRRSALDQLVRSKIDLIASHFALYTMPIIDRLRSVPTVVHFHGPWAAEGTTEGARSYKSWLKAILEWINVKRLGRIYDLDLPLAYRAADMTVVPSQSLEGFGLITLESLASGTPVYVTPEGSMPEIIEPFAAECIFASTTAVDITQGLSDALQARRPLPTDAACRAYSSDNFSWPKIAQRVRAGYNETLA